VVEDYRSLDRFGAYYLKNTVESPAAPVTRMLDWLNSAQTVGNEFDYDCEAESQSYLSALSRADEDTVRAAMIAATGWESKDMNTMVVWCKNDLGWHLVDEGELLCGFNNTGWLEGPTLEPPDDEEACKACKNVGNKRLAAKDSRMTGVAGAKYRDDDSKG
jgi:hypothetical protein